jgi:flagellar capping protein FliD
VTIKLIQPTAVGQNIKLVIDPDIDELLQRVTESAVAIEDLFKGYIDSQTAPDEGEGSEAGALKKNPIMKKLYDGLVNTLTGQVAGLGSDDYRVLSDIGLKLEKTEVEGQSFFNLTTDMTKLKSAVQTSPEKIQRLLAFNYTSSNPKFRIMESPKSLHKDVAGQDILVNVSKDVSGVLSVTLTINGRSFGATIDAKGKILGQGHTAVEGIKLNIASSTLSALGNGQSVTSTVNMTQGLFDRLGDVFQGLLKKSTAGGEYGYMSAGDFQRAEGEAKDKIDDLKTQNTRLNERIEQAKARMQAKVDLLVEMMHRIQSMEDSLQASLDFMKFSGR